MGSLIIYFTFLLQKICKNKVALEKSFIKNEWLNGSDISFKRKTLANGETILEPSTTLSI